MIQSQSVVIWFLKLHSLFKELYTKGGYALNSRVAFPMTGDGYLQSRGAYVPMSHLPLQNTQQ